MSQQSRRNAVAALAEMGQRHSQPANRKTAPVFVLGCPRSGTTLLYHMLLSAGSFATYRSESNVFNLLVPRFGGMRSSRDREDLMRYWLRSKLFRVSGLDALAIQAKIIADCRTGGDFLRMTMEAVARSQGVERWADCTPEHLLYIPEIKREIPNALVIHIIRDGRDVALSYVRQGWAYPLPWDRGEELSVAGLYWEWIVSRGRKTGRALGSDYCEVHYEDLVEKPDETLAGLSEFVGQELDYGRIQQVGIGSVSAPNSSFASGTTGGFHPVGRWVEKMSSAQLANFESLTGTFLRELGYGLRTHPQPGFRSRRLRSTYFAWFAARHWLKNRTPLGRFAKIGRMGIGDAPHRTGR